MTPDDIAAYVDALWNALKERGWSAEYSVRFIEIALREKLRQEATSKGYPKGLRDA